jgi:hypothetical protein
VLSNRLLCRRRAFGLRPAGEAGGAAAPASEACRQTRGVGRAGVAVEERQGSGIKPVRQYGLELLPKETKHFAHFFLLDCQSQTALQSASLTVRRQKLCFPLIFCGQSNIIHLIDQSQIT